MKRTCLRPPALSIGVLLLAGCAGIGHAPQRSEPPLAPSDAILAVEPQAVLAATPPGPTPSVTDKASSVASVPVAPPARPARPASQSGKLAQPAASTPPPPAKTAASPSSAAPPQTTPTPAPPIVKPAAAPPLDLKSLETRLKETRAIGVFTKLTLKNQIDDLLDRFRAFYQGRIKTSLAELRRSFDMLVMKALALLQDADPPLAHALASSRESIWGILSDPAKLATL